MGILNVTPDSFFDGGRYTNVEEQLLQAKKMLDDGAEILDIGGYSTRPGADDVSPEEEMGRVLPVIENLHRHLPEAIISIDTFRASVAEEAVNAGASIINDVSGGEDQDMFDTVARLKVPYILMHKKGAPKDMQIDPRYEDVVKEVIYYFSEKVYALRQKGVADIILDPGFGFGKNLYHNYMLLKNLSLYKTLGCPILAGLSRKSMINKLLHTKAENALNGTTVAHTMAVLNGASILRVHDVKAAKEVFKIVNFYHEPV